MNSGSLEKNIIGAFPSSSKKDWIEIALKELHGEHPFEKLKKTNSGLTIYPYYDISDDANNPFQLSASTDVYKGPRSWENLSIVHVDRAASANQDALLALQSGADGILFSLHQNLFTQKLLEGVQWQHCSLRFLADAAQQKNFIALKEFATKQKLNPKELKGSIFWKTLPDDISGLIGSLKEFEKFQCLGICVEENESKQKAIAHALTQAVNLVEAATQKNISVEQAIRQIAFSVPIGTDFFLEIATLKTLRRLWYQIINAYDSLIPITVHIHAHSSVFDKTQFQDHANLIKSSTAALAAIVGGCDSLSIDAEDYTNPMLQRIARNVSSILQEESHLDLVADPTAGSYYIESLIDQLSKGSWHLLQEQVSS